MPYSKFLVCLHEYAYRLTTPFHRYIRAFEVGVPPTSAKYDIAVRFKTMKNGPVVRNRMRLPHPVKTDLRICVICPPDSKVAAEARAAGASLVGEETVFDAVKDGRIEFDRCICHNDSFQKMNKAGLGRILGPRGLMPNTKFGTVVKDVSSTLRDMVGGSEYRERGGVVRMPVAQLGFTPEEVKTNITAFIRNVKADATKLSDRITKDVHEVVSEKCFMSSIPADNLQVLSSTRSPAFILDGNFRTPDGVDPKDLSTIS